MWNLKQVQILFNEKLGALAQKGNDSLLPITDLPTEFFSGALHCRDDSDKFYYPAQDELPPRLAIKSVNEISGKVSAA